MDVCETVEQAMARQKPYGNDLHILEQRRGRLLQQLEQLAEKLSAAGELLDAVAHSPGDGHCRLLTETTLRSAIGHAHKQLTSNTARRGPRLLPLTDCEAILTAAARYLENGGTDTPQQDGSLVRLGPAPHHGWIWRDEHADDAYGRALRQLVAARYGVPPGSFDAHSIETVRTGARLLEELLPSLAPSALHHAHIVACVPSSRSFGSSSRPDLGGMFFLRHSPESPWWVAEHLLHESMHLKLYDLLDADILMQSDGKHVERPVITPWNPSQLSGANRWHTWRVLAAFHVYAHIALLSTVAERRAPELEGTYGPLSGMIESHRALARARHLCQQLRAHARCWDELDPVSQGLANWLYSLLDILDPAPAPEGSTLHLYLDLYRRETGRVEQMLAEPTRRSDALREALAGLARQDMASTRTILRDLDAREQVAYLDASTTDVQLPDGYPEIRRVIETCLCDASPDGYRMSESGEHDTMVGEMVEGGSDALFALSAGIPADVTHAKRRAVKHQLFTRSCDDKFGRLLAVQAAHLRPNAKVLEIGTGVGVATAWLVSGLGSRTDVDVLSVERDDTLSGAAREYRWPSYVRIETADTATTLADHSDTFDLILADASASTLDNVDAIIDASRSGGMLILTRNAVSAPGEPAGFLTTLLETVLHHDKLVAVDIDWSSGVLIATKRA
jgi:predicted O-methyltransferase YrrM